MALPSPGSTISMSQVRTELGGSGSQSLSAAGVTLASITAGNEVELSNDLGGTSYKELKFNSSYSFYWNWDEYGSINYRTAYVTITPDATFAASQPTNFTRVLYQSSNYVRYYPSGQNIKLVSNLGTSTLTASGYTCTGDCTVSLEQGPFSTTCTTTSPTCLIGDTKIILPSGAKKKIADLKSGDKILGYDFTSHTYKENIINKIFSVDHKDIIKIKMDGRSITCTTDHPFYILGKGWSSFRAGYTNRMYSNIPNHCQPIEVGDKIFTRDGFQIIQSVIHLSGYTPTYQITEAEYDTYFAEDLLTLIEVNLNNPR